MVTYNDEDGLENGTGLVSSPVRVAEEGANEGEEIDSASPFAYIVGRFGIVLSHNSSQKQDQVHPHPEKCQRSKPLVHWLISNQTNQIIELDSTDIYKKWQWVQNTFMDHCQYRTH